MENYFYRKLVFAKSKSSGTSNYADLSNKPQINGVTLDGNKTSEDLGIEQEVTEETLDNVIPKQTATDSIINVNDALKYKTFNFKVDGAYEQNGEPTPEAPIPITTLIFDKITKIGQNLLPNTFFSKHADYSIDDDGWTNLTFDNSDGTSTKYFNLYYNSAKLKSNKNYNVFLEIKNISGAGVLAVCSNATFNQQGEGQFSTDYRLAFSNLQSGNIYNKICLSKTNLDNITSSTRSFVQADPGQAGSITFRISIIEDTTITPENFVYQPYQETNYLIDLQGNEMVGLPNGVKDELTIDKEGNVSLVKRIGKKIINEADLNGINDAWFTLIDYLRLNKPNDYIGYNKVALSNSYNNTLLNKFHRSPKETPRETYDDVYSIIEYQSTSNFALTIPKGTTLEQAREMAAGTVMYYELAEPQTISLGKLSDLISTEQGSNTFAINSNIDTQISITYALDIKKYIDNKMAIVSKAIVEGE